MKNGLKDIITDIFGLGVWAFAIYLKITKGSEMGFWEMAGYIALGGFLFWLNIKELGKLIKQLWGKMIKKKLG
jgi:hypothetical protein